jgi:hypothetical protein
MVFRKYIKILGVTVGLIAIACGQASTDPPWRESLGYSTNEVFRVDLNELGIPVGLQSGLCGGFSDGFTS